MKLLFICTHNRCRSILAEAIANHLSNGQLCAYSAGSSPQERVHPLTLEYLLNHEIETKGLKSQSWDEFDSLNPDAILTLCDHAAQEACPVWFDRTVQVHWGLEDPSKRLETDVQQSERFDLTIEILRQRLSVLIEPSNSELRGEPLRALLIQLASTIN